MSECRECLYFDAPGTTSGWCRRFPTVVIKSPAEWCGEHVFAPCEHENSMRMPDGEWRCKRCSSVVAPPRPLR